MKEAYKEEMILELKKLKKDDIDYYSDYLKRNADFYKIKKIGESTFEINTFLKEKCGDKYKYKFNETKYCKEDDLIEILSSLDKEKNLRYLINWNIHIECTSEEGLLRLDYLMQRYEQEYTISKYIKIEDMNEFYDRNKEIIIKYTKDNIVIDRLNRPLYKYMNKKGLNKSGSISFIIHNLWPHEMIYLSNLIEDVNETNNREFIDFITIVRQRSSFKDIWDYLNNNNCEYIFKSNFEIYDIPDNILNQIKSFLKGLKIDFNIRKTLKNNAILTMFPKKEEVNSFIYDTLKVNNINYIDGYAPDIDSAETTLWMFSLDKTQKEQIKEMLKKVDQDRIDLLKKLGSPDIILDTEKRPVKCNYGFIVNWRVREQIENILSSFKMDYVILDKECEIIKEIEDNNSVNSSYF